ncbi:MAG TPA: FAD-dependent oxidoreductase, partial [Candidatus Eisenbacteria bacterium]|nr:FAD-dependent oxidoreductase [Candidatus Eisenbacteria bacterium]
MEAVEVGIIGAGIHGVSAAFHLVRRGVRPRLFERWAPAGGPTGRSSGVCRAYYTNDFLARVARESLLMFRDFRDLTNGRDAGHHVTGALFLHGRDEAERVREAAARMNAIGTRIELLGPDDLERRHPDLALDGVAVGAWEPTAGYADPVLTTAGLFERAV